MIYICEKCGMVYRAEVQPEECETCGCTFIRKADEREVMDVVASMLLKSDDTILIQENGKRRMKPIHSI